MCHQNTQNGKSLFTRRFIHYQAFTLGEKANLIRTTAFASGHF